MPPLCDRLPLPDDYDSADDKNRTDRGANGDAYNVAI